MLGLVVFGSRTWMCTTPAPALAASIEDWAICCGVTGTAGFLPGESAEPVTAQDMMTLRCMDAASRAGANAPRKSLGEDAPQAQRLPCMQLQAAPKARGSRPEAGSVAACHLLCTALSLPPIPSLERIRKERQGRFPGPAAPATAAGEGGFPVGRRE